MLCNSVWSAGKTCAFDANDRYECLRWITMNHECLQIVKCKRLNVGGDYCVALDFVESDRESDSSHVSNLSVVNERNLPIHQYFNPNNQLMNETRALLNPKPVVVSQPSIPVAVKKVGRRGRPPKKDAKSRSRQGKLYGLHYMGCMWTLIYVFISKTRQNCIVKYFMRS